MADQFEVIGAIPETASYQWVALSVDGDYEVMREHNWEMHLGGWTPVPAGRHPLMPHNDRGHIVVAEQILLERREELSVAARMIELASAKRQYDDSPVGHGREGHSTPMAFCPAIVATPRLSMEAQEAARNELGVIDGQRYAEFVVQIGLVLSDSEIDTALNALRLPLPEYARRKFLMNVNYLMKISGHVYDYAGVKVFKSISLKADEEA